MAKEKRVKLYPWQKQIAKEEYVARVEAGDRSVGFFMPTAQYYATEMNHPERLKKVELQMKKKADVKAQHKQYIAKKIATAIEVGKRLGVREFRKSDSFKAKLEIAYKHGLSDGKPRQTKLERAAKLEAKAQEIMKRAKELKQ
jgi:hypothetical protein